MVVEVGLWWWWWVVDWVVFVGLRLWSGSGSDQAMFVFMGFVGGWDWLGWSLVWLGVAIGGCCWLWRWCGFFCWLSLSFLVGFFVAVFVGFFLWVCWIFVFFFCVILVGFWDDFVANLVNLGFGNGGLWTVEVVVGCGLWVAVEVAGVLGLLVVLQNRQRQIKWGMKEIIKN